MNDRELAKRLRRADARFEPKTLRAETAETRAAWLVEGQRRIQRGRARRLWIGAFCALLLSFPAWRPWLPARGVTDADGVLANATPTPITATSKAPELANVLAASGRMTRRASALHRIEDRQASLRGASDPVGRHADWLAWTWQRRGAREAAAGRTDHAIATRERLLTSFPESAAARFLAGDRKLPSTDRLPR